MEKKEHEPLIESGGTQQQASKPKPEKCEDKQEKQREQAEDTGGQETDNKHDDRTEKDVSGSQEETKEQDETAQGGTDRPQNVTTEKKEPEAQSDLKDKTSGEPENDRICQRVGTDVHKRTEKTEEEEDKTHQLRPQAFSGGVTPIEKRQDREDTGEPKAEEMGGNNSSDGEGSSVSVTKENIGSTKSLRDHHTAGQNEEQHRACEEQLNQRQQAEDAERQETDHEQEGPGPVRQTEEPQEPHQGGITNKLQENTSKENDTKDLTDVKDGTSKELGKADDAKDKGVKVTGETVQTREGQNEQKPATSSEKESIEQLQDPGHRGNTEEPQAKTSENKETDQKGKKPEEAEGNDEQTPSGEEPTKKPEDSDQKGNTNKRQAQTSEENKTAMMDDKTSNDQGGQQRTEGGTTGTSTGNDQKPSEEQTEEPKAGSGHQQSEHAGVPQGTTVEAEAFASEEKFTEKQEKPQEDEEGARQTTEEEIEPRTGKK